MTEGLTTSKPYEPGDNVQVVERNKLGLVTLALYQASNTPERYEAWVVFSGENDIGFLGALRKGFRHCYVIARDAHGWFAMDPMMNHVDMQVMWHVARDFNLPSWLRSSGMTVIPAFVLRKRRTLYLGPYTCVSIVKRFLGIHKPWILTPYHLYRYLADEAALSRMVYYDWGFAPDDKPNSVLRDALEKV